MQRNFVLILFSIIFCIPSYAKNNTLITQKDVDSWYPNRKMLRMFKKHGNLYYFHYDVFSCTAMSVTNREVYLRKYYCNKLIKQEKKQIDLDLLHCNNIETFLIPFLEKDYVGKCMMIDGDSFSYMIKTNNQKCEDMIPVDIDCFITYVSDDSLKKILLLLKDF